MKNLNKTQTKILEKLLSKVGDMFFKRRIYKVLEYLKIEKDDKILDVGCGEGFYELVISNLYDCNIVAIDNDKKILNMAKKQLGKNKKIKLELQNVKKLPYKSTSFDKIICTEVLEHINEDDVVVKELYRVLKPGGILAITVPNENYPLLWDPLNKVRGYLGLGHFDPKDKFFGGIWSYDHKRLYSPNTLNKLLNEAGLKVKKIEVITKYGLPFNVLVLNLGKAFYTQLPVDESIKNQMEKFDWEKEKQPRNFYTSMIDAVFSVIKWIDKYNEKKFDLGTSTMGVCALCEKPKL